MSAIEMMDPKMDAGMLCNKSRNCSIEEAIANGRLKVRRLSVNEIRAVLDSSFRCFVSWLEGHSLAQTVFTNLYLHNPALIEDRTMRTLAMVSVKLVFVIKEIIYKIGAFEEEDFHGVTYNFYLGQDVLDSKACSLIRMASVVSFRMRCAEFRPLAIVNSCCPLRHLSAGVRWNLGIEVRWNLLKSGGAHWGLLRVSTTR